MLINWFKENFTEIFLLKCSSKGPELSPIRHDWGTLENGFQAHHPTPAYLIDLWKFLANVWHAIFPKHFRRHAESMSCHMAFVIKTAGLAARY